MNLLAGALLGPYVGIPFVAVLTALGASSAYLLSKYSGKHLVKKHFEERIEIFSKIVHSQSHHHLVIYLVGLRIFPFTPNWFLNYVSPVVNIKLGDLNNTSEIIQTKLIILFVFISLVLVLPIKMRENKHFIRLKSYFKIE
jgi:uncharacterized membrane protein YdjX (TVP38/TMEM64 family)